MEQDRLKVLNAVGLGIDLDRCWNPGLRQRS